MFKHNLIFGSACLAGFLGLSTLSVASDKYMHVTFDNQSGRTLYIDVVKSQSGQVYSFKNDSLHSNFNNALGHDVKRIPPAKKDKTTVNITKQALKGGARIYISTNQFTDHIMGNIPGAPNLALYPYIYDKVETGWTPNGSAVWNTTAVDFFGLPLRMQFTKGKNKKTVGLCKYIKQVRSSGGQKYYQCAAQGKHTDKLTRERVINQLRNSLQNQPQLYDQKYYKKGDDAQLARVFSPQHFYTTVSSKKLTEYIHHHLKKLVKHWKKGFTYKYGGFTYKNPKYHNGTLTIDETTKQQTITLTDITPGKVMAGEINAQPSTPGAEKFAGMIATVINRGVLANPKHWGDNGAPNKGTPQYYYTDRFTANKYNYNAYAAALTAIAVNRKFYALSYADFWHMDPSLEVNNKNAKNGITITILPFDEN